MSKLACALTKTSRKRAGISYPPTVIILIFIISCCRGIRYTYPWRPKPDACCLSPSLFRKASGTQVVTWLWSLACQFPKATPCKAMNIVQFLLCPIIGHRIHAVIHDGVEPHNLPGSVWWFHRFTCTAYEFGEQFDSIPEPTVAVHVTHLASRCRHRPRTWLVESS